MMSDNAAFTGWIKEPKCRWRKAVQAESEDAAWRKLLDVRAASRCVLPTDQDPNASPANHERRGSTHEAQHR